MYINSFTHPRRAPPIPPGPSMGLPLKQSVPQLIISILALFSLRVCVSGRVASCLENGMFSFSGTVFAVLARPLIFTMEVTEIMAAPTHHTPRIHSITSQNGLLGTLR